MSVEKLLRNPTIRTYLRAFKPSETDAAIKLTLIYGIQSLRAHHTALHVMTIERLEQLIRQNAFAIGVEDSIPALNEQLQLITSTITDIHRDVAHQPIEHSAAVFKPTPNANQKPSATGKGAAPITVTAPKTAAAAAAVASKRSGRARSPPKPAAVVVGRDGRVRSPHAGNRKPVGTSDFRTPPPAGSSTTPVSVAKPSSQWRTGDPTPQFDEIKTSSPPQSGSGSGAGTDGEAAANADSNAVVYPKWWSDSVAPFAAPPPPPPPGHLNRSQPRLAYASIDRSTESERRNTALINDDCVTSRYLNIASSGYGPATARPPATAPGAAPAGQPPQPVQPVFASTTGGGAGSCHANGMYPLIPVMTPNGGLMYASLQPFTPTATAPATTAVPTAAPVPVTAATLPAASLVFGPSLSSKAPAARPTSAPAAKPALARFDDSELAVHSNLQPNRPAAAATKGCGGGGGAKQKRESKKSVKFTSARPVPPPADTGRYGTGSFGGGGRPETQSERTVKPAEPRPSSSGLDGKYAHVKPKLRDQILADKRQHKQKTRNTREAMADIIGSVYSDANRRPPAGGAYSKPRRDAASASTNAPLSLGSALDALDDPMMAGFVMPNRDSTLPVHGSSKHGPSPPQNGGGTAKPAGSPADSNASSSDAVGTTGGSVDSKYGPPPPPPPQANPNSLPAAASLFPVSRPLHASVQAATAAAAAADAGPQTPSPYGNGMSFADRLASIATPNTRLPSAVDAATRTAASRVPRDTNVASSYTAANVDRHNCTLSVPFGSANPSQPSTFIEHAATANDNRLYGSELDQNKRAVAFDIAAGEEDGNDDVAGDMDAMIHRSNRVWAERVSAAVESRLGYNGFVGEYGPTHTWTVPPNARQPRHTLASTQTQPPRPVAASAESPLAVSDIHDSQPQPLQPQPQPFSPVTAPTAAAATIPTPASASAVASDESWNLSKLASPATPASGV